MSSGFAPVNLGGGGSSGGLLDPNLSEDGREPFRTISQGLIQANEAASKKLTERVPAVRFPEFRSEKYDPTTVPRTAMDKTVSVFNFLFGAELAAFGVTADATGFDISMERAVRQWSEEPLWSALAVAGLAANFALPISTSFRFGKLGAALGKGFKIEDRVGLFGEAGHTVRWFEQFDTLVQEFEFLKRIGSLDEGITSLDDIGQHAIRRARQSAHTMLSRTDRYLRKEALMTRNFEVESAVKKLMEERGIQVANIAEAPPELVEQAMKQVADPGVNWTVRDRVFDWFETSFANSFFAVNNEMSPAGQLRKDLLERFEKFAEPRRFGLWTETISAVRNDPKFAPKFVQKALEQAYGRSVGAPKTVGAAEARVIDSILGYKDTVQKRYFATGALDSATHPSLHVVGLRSWGKDYKVPPSLGAASSAESAIKEPLGMVTLRERRSSPEKLLELAEKGGLLTDDVDKIVMTSIADDLYLHNYETLVDLVSKEEFVYKPLNLATKDPVTVSYQISKYEDVMRLHKQPHLVPKNLVSLDKMFVDNDMIPERDMFMRMLEKKAPHMISTTEDGRKALPYMPKFMADAMFDPEMGLVAQSQMATFTLAQMLTGMYKTAKTGLNPGTHVQNILGNIAFMSQAGFNVLRPENMKLMRQVTDVFKEIHDVHRKVRGVHGENAPIKLIRQKLTEELAQLGKSVTYTSSKGRKIKVAYSEFADDIVQQLYEHSSFDEVEGAAALRQQIANLPKGSTLHKFGSFMEADVHDRFFSWLGVPGTDLNLKNLFDGMTKWYLGEDVIPKLAMFVANKADGLTKQAAVTEVARRMPMYGTVGTLIRDGRSKVFPWLSFPTEALRITKNNLLDNPLRMLPWLHATSIAQSMFALGGIGEGTQQAVDEAQENLPIFAQTPSTVATASQGILGHSAPGIAQGALTGGAVGAAFGGLPGAAVGGLAGGVLGASAGISDAVLQAAGIGDDTLLGKLFADKSRDELTIRGTVLNWLPHTAFWLQGDSPHFNPLESGISGKESIARMMRVSPTGEPLAILKPFIDLVLGQDPMTGQPIPAEGPIDIMSKIVGGYIGLLSPPYIQKYGFKVTTPDVGMSDAITALGRGAGVLDKDATTPSIIRKLDPTNVSRLATDMGMLQDSVTGMPGSAILDIFLHNANILKSHPAYAERFFANENLNHSSMADVRNFHARNLAFFIENGMEAETTETIRKVYMSFQQEYMNSPVDGVDKFERWIKDRWGLLRRHRDLASISNDELELRFAESTSFAKQTVSLARQQRLDAIKKERENRALKEEMKRLALDF